MGLEKVLVLAEEKLFEKLKMLKENCTALVHGAEFDLVLVCVRACII